MREPTYATNHAEPTGIRVDDPPTVVTAGSAGVTPPTEHTVRDLVVRRNPLYPGDDEVSPEAQTAVVPVR